MEKTHQETYPPYIPFYYILYLKYRKLKRQSATRKMERLARKIGPVGFVPEGEGQWTVEVEGEIPNPTDHINRSALWMDEDLALPEIQEIITGIEATKKKLDAKDLRYTSTAASFIPRMYTEYSEKKNSWENAWCFRHADVQKGQNILDIGGASTAFNFFLADKGCSVTSIDNDWGNCGIVYNMNYVGQKMGWECRAIDRDAGQPLPFPDNHFERIFSVCVIEHLTSPDRQNLMRELGRVLKPGGIAAFSTDYDNEREVLVFDKGLRFGYREKFFHDVVDPSGLRLHGNSTLIDAYPLKNFLGAFFLRKD
ncbi:MAG: class I SAM-dependent methyltransferase [Candidatus Omnitrophica bacterium]|nr:class I SAM-dependent methyltransferase [Candidatus Omnitrophota bacterium]MCB9722160.1 class I SAM-dependent methyltransferase [Candidatus Omnitrophota bacterium]